jgi:signal transduction histidine kinase
MTVVQRLRRSLAAKLLAAQVLVVAAGSLTLAVVALAVAPGVFTRHARMAPGGLAPEVVRHLDQGLGAAMLAALAAGTAVALLTAVAVSWVLARQIVRPIGTLAQAARRVERGSYAARIPVPGSGDELTDLGQAFNAMAGALASSEERRRRLLADLAHELRTPLATIDGYLEGVADGVMPADAATWEVLRAETARLARLVDDLNAVSRAEEHQLDLRLVRCEPGEVVGAAVRAATAAYAAKEVELAARVDRRLPRVEADPDRLGEVLANLLGNALRHTPARGRVEVAAARGAGGVELTVTDTGEGIPPELLGRVFERFYRVDRARGRAADGGRGSGIGLTISRAIVHAHGGRIRAESAGPGHGARFVVTLPAAADE